jgi:AbrB family looped-hinge helix DNA binding protein
MRVTTKGQVTIPQEIRERLNIKPASSVDFKIAEDGRVYLIKTEEPTDRPNRFARLRGAATVRMTTDEIMALTRGDE